MQVVHVYAFTLVQHITSGDGPIPVAEHDNTGIGCRIDVFQ
jgi:hypothetical protein